MAVRHPTAEDHLRDPEGEELDSMKPGVSSNGGYPQSPPQVLIILVGKPHGFVGETHHFCKTPNMGNVQYCRDQYFEYPIGGINILNIQYPIIL